MILLEGLKGQKTGRVKYNYLDMYGFSNVWKNEDTLYLKIYRHFVRKHNDWRLLQKWYSITLFVSMYK